MGTAQLLTAQLDRGKQDSLNVHKNIAPNKRRIFQLHGARKVIVNMKTAPYSL